MLIFLTLLVFIAACGQEEAKPVSTDETPEVEKTDSKPADSESEDDKSSSQKQSEWMEGQTGLEAQAEVTSIKFYKWLDESVGTETITVYAEIKNTSDTSIDAGRVNITYLDSGGGVIAVNDAQVSPRFINAGSTGYVSTEIEGSINDYEDLVDIQIEVSPEPFQDAEIVDFSTRDENLKIDTWGEESAKISVTGFFENDSDANFTEDDVSAVIVLYDAEDNFLASQTSHSDQSFSIDANDETSFEVGGGWPLPPEVGEKVDHTEVRAIGIENMDDYWW